MLEELCALLSKPASGLELSKPAATHSSSVAKFPPLLETPDEIQKVKSALSKISPDALHGTGSIDDIDTDPKNYWLAVIWAINSLNWRCGKQLAIEWSMQSDRFNPDEFDSDWNSYNPAKDKAIGIGSLFRLAKTFEIKSWGPLVFEADRIAAAQQSANDDQANGGQFENAPTRSVFTLEDGDLLLPAKAPPPRDYVFANSVTRGTAIMVGGLGGTSKTTLVMLMAIHSALGKDWGSLQIREGSSLLFLGEESADEKARRFGGLCADLTPAERQRVIERVRAFPAIGKDLRVTQTIGADPQPTMFADEIIRLSLAHQEESGIELSFIVLDHTRLFMSGDPNAADDVSQLTRVLAYIANATQAVVVLIAHSPKSAMSKEGASDASEIFGSGAFTDNTRGTFVLNTMRPEEAKTYGKDEYERSNYVCLTNVKANYGKTGDTWWFRKESVPDWQIGTLVPEVMYSTKLYPEFSGLSKRLVELVEYKPGKLTVSNVRQRAGKAGELKASEREVRATIERMLDEGQLILEPLTKEQRAERGLSANVKEVLNLPTAG
jgi:RecA-family ATPase